MEKFPIHVRGEGCFELWISLDRVCEKIDVKRSDGIWVKEYPFTKRQLKKIFKYIVTYCDDETLDEAQAFLDENKADYGRMFRGVRTGEIRVRI